MNVPVRRTLNRIFTVSSGGAVLLMLAALVIILVPLVWKGSEAVVFKQTIEFRKWERDEYGRGGEQLEEDIKKAGAARAAVYRILTEHQSNIIPEDNENKAVQVYRDYKDQMSNRVDDGRLSEEKYREYRAKARAIRTDLTDAYNAVDRKKMLTLLDGVLAQSDAACFQGTVAMRFFELAEKYKAFVEETDIDFSTRDAYAEKLKQLRDEINKLFGEPDKKLPRLQYGATRWSHVERRVHHILWRVERQFNPETGLDDIEIEKPRADDFRGAQMAKLFGMFQDTRQLERMFLPEWRFYWQYFIDRPSHIYFGGIGLEVMGTVFLTFFSMLCAFPVGVTAAAYLASRVNEGPVIKVIRACVNTLAGVPSVAFGLFGMVFFRDYVQEVLGWGSGRSIFAGALTLGILVLPVIIRASEEAIRAVPRKWREASLGLGASTGSTFFKVTFPAALPGILTGVILSMSRAAGETAPLMFTACPLVCNTLPTSPADPVKALSYSSYFLAHGDPNASSYPEQQYGMVMALIMVVLLLNIGAIILRGRYSKKLKGH